MMPQREANDSTDEQVGPAYGRYEGNQTSTHQQQYESPYEQSLSQGVAGKVYPAPRNNKNIYSLIVFVIAMAMLLLFALLAIFFIGGTGGWVTLIVIAGVIFLMAAVTIDKIQ
jgi:fatty acid desaturase